MLIDIDHALDYFNWYVRRDLRHSLVVFHAWEFAFVGLALLLVVWYHPLFLAAVLGYWGHIAADQLANHLHPMAYSLSYRAYHRFDRVSLMGEEISDFSKVVRAAVPLSRFWEPWALRAVSRLRRDRT